MNLDRIIVAGRADGCLIITLKENSLLDPGQKCSVIDLLSGELSDCVTIQQIEQDFPFQYVSSETEQEVLCEIMQEIVPDQTLRLLIDRLAKQGYSN